MFSSSILGVLFGTVLLISSIPDAASYTKYGRTCKDIGCRNDEVCVMAEDPCSIYQRDNCGRYPTCAKSHPGEVSCASTVCGENEYCKTEASGPTCVKKSTGIGSAGVDYVNGHRTSENREKTSSNSASDSNPFANANAPPAPIEPAGGFHQVNTGGNLGYPASYPSNSGSNSGYPPYSNNRGSSNGYPPYPSTNQGNRQSDLGYPPYPTHNKMPMPGHPGQASYPGYSGQPSYPAPPGYPQQYPGFQNYPYGNYPNQNRMHYNTVHSGYRRNSAVAGSPSFLMIACVIGLVAAVTSRS